MESAGGRDDCVVCFPLALNFQKVSLRILQMKRVPRGLCQAVRHIWKWARVMLLVSSSVPREPFLTTVGRQEGCWVPFNRISSVSGAARS